MNRLLVVVGLIGLALPTFSGHVGLDQLLQKQNEPQQDCPAECFCDMVVLFATCTGDATKTSLPSLPWLSTSPDAPSSASVRTRRIEIHDFVLGDVSLDQPTHYKLFHFLEELHLSHNQITVIHFLMQESYRAETRTEPSLQLLDLSSNNLTYFDSVAEYRLLKVLDLSHNQIHRLQLNGLEKLESLNLKSNDIEELSPDIFQSLKSIQYINLDSNRLKKLHPNLFSNLPSLVHLILSSNPFELDRTSVLLNARTQFIDISSVGLDHVPPAMFGTVRDLRLNNNKLKRILTSDFESYPNVGLLVLDENQIEIIENDAFGRMELLTSLWLNGNRLSSIPQNLPSSLTSLQLEENRITALNASSFASLHNLEHLNLHLNRITALEPDALASLSSLVTLNLGTNLIDMLYRDSLRNLSKLTVLDLSGNPLKVVVNGAFGHTRQLQALHLARINEQEIEFDAGMFDSLVSLQLLDLSNSKNFTRQILAAQCLSRGWLKSLRELNIERCDLRIELSLLCSELLQLDSLVTVRARGNSFNRSTSSTSVMSGKVVTAVADNSDNENDNLDSYSSIQKLCPAGTTRDQDVPTNASTSAGAGKGDEMSLVDADRERERKVSLTLTTIANTKSSNSSSAAVAAAVSASSSSINVTASSNEAPTRVGSSTTTSRQAPTARTRSSNSTSTTTKLKEEGPGDIATASALSSTPTSAPTSTTSTSTSSYFDSTWSKTHTKTKYQETNEYEAASGVGSIDGFPADLSGRTTINSNTLGNTAGRERDGSSGSATFGQEHDQEHNDDFAKGSFHGVLPQPQKMYLAQASALASASGGGATAEEKTASKSLILKTILISAGTCLLSVLLLLGFGLVLFRWNGGRFVRGARTREATCATDSYKRLEERQELELGISNRMYYEGGQVYHIS